MKTKNKGNKQVVESRKRRESSVGGAMTPQERERVSRDVNRNFTPNDADDADATIPHTTGAPD